VRLLTAPGILVPLRSRLMDARSENVLIEALYDAALGHRPWLGVSQELMRYGGGESLMLSAQNTRTGQVDLLGWLGLSPEAIGEYAAFAQHDVWVQGYVGRRLFGRMMVGSAVVEERALKRSLIYNEYLRPKHVNIFHLVGAVIPMDGGYQATVGIHRPIDGRDFSPQEARWTQRLLPHLQRALEVRRRLQQAEQESRSVHAVLDRLSLGVILLGATGRLLHVNAAADVILRGGDGLARTPNGLHALRKDDDRRLQDMIGALRHPVGERRSAGGHLRIHRPSGQAAYAAMLAPLGPSMQRDDRESPTILMFVSDPGAKIVADLAVLSDLFGLPAGEGRLVLALLSGIAPPEYARRTNISYNTAKTLLARAMARTDTRSQIELVLLVASAFGGTSLRP
jgi:DNA-binding CsgD family transcriptional regulator/PAS domain-containing protein